MRHYNRQKPKEKTKLKKQNYYYKLVDKTVGEIILTTNQKTLSAELFYRISRGHIAEVTLDIEKQPEEDGSICDKYDLAD